MNPAVTSREEILKVCRAVVSAEGLPALSMRRVAEDCGVALGSLYHYFPSKDEMLTATVESVWRDIFHQEQGCPAGLPFPDSVRRLFSCVRESAGKYPGFSMAHSVGFASSAREEGRQAMQRCFGHLKAGLAQALRDDPAVSPAAFAGAFSREAFIDFVFSALLFTLAEEKEDCEVLAEVIRRTIYPA